VKCKNQLQFSSFALYVSYHLWYAYAPIKYILACAL